MKGGFHILTRGILGCQGGRHSLHHNILPVAAVSGRQEEIRGEETGSDLPRCD